MVHCPKGRSLEEPIVENGFGSTTSDALSAIVSRHALRLIHHESLRQGPLFQSARAATSGTSITITRSNRTP
jgi:hypothetical protein